MTAAYSTYRHCLSVSLEAKPFKVDAVTKGKTVPHSHPRPISRNFFAGWQRFPRGHPRKKDAPLSAFQPAPALAGFSPLFDIMATSHPTYLGIHFQLTDQSWSENGMEQFVILQLAICIISIRHVHFPLLPPTPFMVPLRDRPSCTGSLVGAHLIKYNSSTKPPNHTSFSTAQRRSQSERRRVLTTDDQPGCSHSTEPPPFPCCPHRLWRRGLIDSTSAAYPEYGQY